MLCRHLDNENRLTQETKDLDTQLKACQKDLFDINEFLLNELKVHHRSMFLTISASARCIYSNRVSTSPIRVAVQVQALITAELEQRLREAGSQAEETSTAHQVWPCEENAFHNKKSCHCDSQRLMRMLLRSA